MAAQRATRSPWRAAASPDAKARLAHVQAVLRGGRARRRHGRPLCVRRGHGWGPRGDRAHAVGRAGPRRILFGLDPVPRRVAQLRERNNRHPYVPRFFSSVAHEVCQGRVEGFVYTWQDNAHQQCSWDYAEYHLTAFTQWSGTDQEVWLWFLRVESDLCGALLDSVAGAADRPKLDSALGASVSLD